MTREVQILRDLVAIPSVSSMSNRPVIDYVLRHLDPKMWTIQLHPYRGVNGIEKTNLVAIAPRGSRRSAELALVCHTDTVPFDPAWREAVNPEVRGGKLYGRGSCDVKGFLACILAAFASVDLARLSKPLALICTADEEVGCVGAKLLARKKAFRSRYMWIGEPTGLRPVRAGKGYALAEIVVRGREAHSAFPGRGRSAIIDASHVIARLERMSGKLARKKNPAFDPPFTTLNAGLIRGGTAKNIIPGECRITVEWRPIPGQHPSWAASLIRDEMKRLARERPGFQASLAVQRLDPPFEGGSSADLASALESLAGRRCTTVAFGTEAAHLRSLTCEAVVFGPGNMHAAHQTGEFVPVRQLSECVRCLRAVIGKLCQ